MERWHAVDAEGRDPATGRPPRPPGSPSPAAALMAVPVATWPLTTVTAAGRVAGVDKALGDGGKRVVNLLDRLAARTAPPADLAVDTVVQATPAGRLGLPVATVSLARAVAAANAVQPGWLAHVDDKRAAPRWVLRSMHREMALEAALNLATLLGTDRVDDEEDVAVRVASGARLWLLSAAVSWALVSDRNPFAAWGELVSYRVWPVGPVDGQLLVCLASAHPTSTDHAAARRRLPTDLLRQGT